MGLRESMLAQYITDPEAIQFLQKLFLNLGFLAEVHTLHVRIIQGAQQLARKESSHSKTHLAGSLGEAKACVP